MVSIVAAVLSVAFFPAFMLAGMERVAHRKVSDVLSLRSVAPAADRITNLPGFSVSTANFEQYAGLVTVNESHGRNLYYWYGDAQECSGAREILYAVCIEYDRSFSGS